MRSRVALVLVVLAMSWAIDAALPWRKPNSKPKVNKRLQPAKVYTKGEYFKPTIVPKGDARARPPSAAAGVAAAVGAAPGDMYDPIPLLKLAVEDDPTLCATEATAIRKLPMHFSDVVATVAAGEKVSATSTVSFSTSGDFIWIGVKAMGVIGYVAQRYLDSCPGGPVSPDSPRMPRQMKASLVQSGSGGYPLYKQCDPAWKTQPMGTCSASICSVGCAVSSVAMILSKRGVTQNPSTLNAWLKANGGYAGGCSLVWGSVDKFGKTRCLGYQSGNYQTVCGWINAGRGVIGNVNRGAHYVLLTGCDGKGNYNVNDPGFARLTYASSEVIKTMVYQ